MSKAKRQMLTLIVLVVVLVVAIFGYKLISKYKTDTTSDTSSTTSETDEDTIKLYALKSSKVNKISFKTDKLKMTLVKSSDTWKNADVSDFPVNQSNALAMVNTAIEIDATKLVTSKCEDLSEYGLDKPDLTFTIETSTGKSEKVYVGDESIAAGGRYAYIDGSDSKVYVISSDVFSSFDYTLKQMISMESVPSITTDYITKFYVASKKGDDFEADYDEDYASSDNWAVTQPYKYPTGADKTKLDTLFSGLSSVQYSECETYKATAADLKKYGLNDPDYILSVGYYNLETSTESSAAPTATPVVKKTVKKYTLEIGKLDSSGEYYYVKPTGSTYIYKMAVSALSSYVSIDPISYTASAYYSPSSGDLKSIDLTYDSKSYSFDVSKTKKEGTDVTLSPYATATPEPTGDSGSQTYDFTFKSGTTTINSKKFLKAYDAFGDLSITAMIDEDAKVTGNKAIASITFHEDKQDVTLKFYPYDGNNFYRVEVNGKMQFLSDISAVDQALSNLAGLAQ